jgi:aspartyl-tRNA(Asn)/glutamyl-tRNA(Gln) amidotransferase subunit A
VPSDLALLPITTLSNLIAQRQISAKELLVDIITNIDRFDAALRSYITVAKDSALAEAEAADSEISAGRRLGPLHGIPISHKDVIWTKKVRTTAHSRTMLEFVPEEDATAVRRLHEAGAIMLGKTNTTEFACGRMEIYGTARNPWDLSRYTGGSSCGSANAVAAGLAIAATGSDTGGSVRAPSALCGIVGLRPTYGRVSRYGLVPLSWSMDTIGPMTRTVADCAVMLRAMAGPDPLDLSTADEPVPDYAAALNGDVASVVLGVPESHFYEDLDGGVDAAVQDALRCFERLGVRLRAVSLPGAPRALHVGNAVLYAEAFGMHAKRLRAQWDDVSPRSRRRMAVGAFLSAGEYQQAARLRAMWMRELDEVLSTVDALITPTVRFPAFGVEIQETDHPPDTGLNTRPFSVAGVPAISVPCGFTGEGLPVGLQVIGRPFAEETIFRIAHAFQLATDWHTKRPSLGG